MNILDVSGEDYKNIIVNPFSEFDTFDFVELNKFKVDKIKYFIFENNKKRFGLVAGIKNNVLKIPFSATFGCFSEIHEKNKIEYYYDSVHSLIDWTRKNKITSINIATPALIYDKNHITKFQNALINNGFNMSHYDVNFEFDLYKFDENEYLSKINRAARKCLNSSLRNNLEFEKTDDIKTVYEIIKRNREFRGFPLRMSLNEVKNNTIKSDFFLVKTHENISIASALVHYLTKNVLRVVYWGNLPEKEEYRPINFMAFNLLKYYKNSGYKILDIGTSTVDGVANFGLCNFKEKIGCECSPKLSFIWRN